MSSARHSRILCLGGLVPLAALLLLFTGCDCRCGKKKPQATKQKKSFAGRGAVPRKRSIRIRKTRADRPLMKKIAMHTHSLRIHVRQGFPTRVPSKVLSGHLGRLPLAYRPKRFMELAKKAKKQALAVADSEKPKRAYKDLIATCISCHELYARSTLRKVEHLRYKEDKHAPRAKKDP